MQDILSVLDRKAFIGSFLDGKNLGPLVIQEGKGKEAECRAFSWNDYGAVMARIWDTYMQTIGSTPCNICQQFPFSNLLETDFAVPNRDALDYMHEVAGVILFPKK